VSSVSSSYVPSLLILVLPLSYDRVLASVPQQRVAPYLRNHWLGAGGAEARSLLYLAVNYGSSFARLPAPGALCHHLLWQLASIIDDAGGAWRAFANGINVLQSVSKSALA